MFEIPIAIGLSPNTQNDDIWQAIKTLVKFWEWKDGSAQKQVENWFKKYFGFKEIFLFNSGRSALYTILKSFGIGSGDEVLIQAFTCVAVPDPIIWTSAKPIYVDIDDSLNIDPTLLEKHITSKTKAIIVQHTFGVPAKLELITKIVQKYNLILIEDCAHALGAKINGKKIGTFGDAAIFSFGRDKVISSVFGGLGTISGKRKAESGKLQEYHKKLSYPNYFWILQQLLHPIIFAVILPLYNLIIGKVILALSLKLKLLSKPVYQEEFTGGKPDIFPKKFPNALANLLLVQLGKLGIYNMKRRQIADYYFDRLSKNKDIQLPPKIEGSIYLRFNILVDNADELIKRAKNRGIILGNWYKNIIDPVGVDLERTGYIKGSCPKAENYAELSVNLPTYPRLTRDDLKSVIKLF